MHDQEQLLRPRREEDQEDGFQARVRRQVRRRVQDGTRHEDQEGRQEELTVLPLIELTIPAVRWGLLFWG